MPGHGGVTGLRSGAAGVEHAGGQGVDHHDLAGDLLGVEDFRSWRQAVEQNELVDPIHLSDSPASHPMRDLTHAAIQTRNVHGGLLGEDVHHPVILSAHRLTAGDQVGGRELDDVFGL